MAAAAPKTNIDVDQNAEPASKPAEPGKQAAVDLAMADGQAAVSPARDLQARLLEEISTPGRLSRRHVLATILTVCLSTWLAGYILYAAL